MSTCFPKNQVQKEYEMANFWSTSKCYLVMSLPINSRITRRKSFWPILYSVCCVFWKFGHRKVCFQNYFLCYKMNILPLIRAVRETVSLTPPFPSHLFLMVWRKQAYLGVKYWIYSIRNSFGNNFCCDQSCRWCWTMLGKIKKSTIIFTRKFTRDS